MDERAAKDMAAIKAREAEVVVAIAERRAEVDVGPFTMAQLGLSQVFADPFGGLWILSGQKLKRAGWME